VFNRARAFLLLLIKLKSI